MQDGNVARCSSADRRSKERAMHDKFSLRNTAPDPDPRQKCSANFLAKADGQGGILQQGEILPMRDWRPTKFYRS
jgi:hypothetical protein